jgi:hypothetical protein
MEEGDSLNATLVEGEDYYFEQELMVFTARYHLRRGYCCDQGCRNCPYGPTQEKAAADVNNASD